MKMELQDEPYHIALQIELIKHFRACGLEILQRKNNNEIILHPDNYMVVKDLLIIYYFACILILKLK